MLFKQQGAILHTSVFAASYHQCVIATKLSLMRIRAILEYFLFTGWHRRINRKAVHASPPLCILVPLLQKEATITETSIVAEDQHRDTRPRRTKMEETLISLAEQYMAGDVTTTAYLKYCSHTTAHTSVSGADEAPDSDIDNIPVQSNAMYNSSLLFVNIESETNFIN